MPLLEELNREGVPYCVVGGVGVLIQASREQGAAIRATRDIDIMVPRDLSNLRFLTLYADAYDMDASERMELEESLRYATEDGSVSEFDNCCVRPFGQYGREAPIPDVDLVRSLNGFILDELDGETVPVLGVDVHVATKEQLLEMKRRTIDLLHADIKTTSRPQDFQDERNLTKLIEKERNHAQERPSR